MAVTPTRGFWMHVMISKLNATIKEVGDQIGWESDNQVVGPRAYGAKVSLLRAIPHMLPPYEDSTYRLVLEHGDFGIHNTSITVPDPDHPHVTSLYDRETGAIVPAMLADPLIAVMPVDLMVDQDGNAGVTRVPMNTTEKEMTCYVTWATQYVEELYRKAPSMKHAIEAGKDVRHLWFALRDWRGADPEQFFGQLGDWAESRLQEMGISY